MTDAHQPEPQKTAAPGERGASYALAVVFAVLAACIVTSGALYYRNHEQHHRAAVAQQISIVADLKVRELAQYRKERLGDGAMLYKNALFSALVRRFFEQENDPEALRPLQAWLGKYQAHYQYNELRLLDDRGVTRLSAPEGLPPTTSNTLQAAAEVLRSGQEAFQDFYRSERDQRVHLAVLVPIYHELDATRPLGVVVLRIDPSTYLYPLLQRWPAPSRSAETLLVRREGREVVFLNELRFQTNTALRLRLPLERLALPAAQAVLGHEGLMQGIDYRGVPVVAVARTIADSPWSLVARMDAAEVDAPMRDQLWQIIALVGAFLLAVGAGVGLAWRQQHVWRYRKQLESAELLRTSELRYRRLFEAARDGILILDAETGMVADVNPFMIELLGYSRESFLGKKLWELGFLKDHSANHANFAELQEKQYVRYEDLALETSDGRRTEVEFVSNVYLVNHHKVIQCNIRDISERKRAEKAQQESEDRFRTMANSFSQLAWAAKADGFITWYNERWYEYTGTTPAQMEGWGWQSVHDPQALPAVMENWTGAIATGTPFEMEFPLRAADGKFRSFLTRAQPLKDAAGRVVQWFGTSTDVESLRQAREEVQQLSAVLEERVRERTVQLEVANQELEAFSYSVSHDLRAPLRHVQGYVAMLGREVGGQLSDKGRYYMKTIADASREMGTLIDDLLAFSRMGRAEMLETWVSLDGVVQESLRRLEEATLGRNITWKLPPLPAVRGDPAMLKQVFANLLGNAVKYTRPRDAAQIELGCGGQESGRVILFVRDNGVGFDSQYAHKLFGVFQRLHRAEEFEGTGIGLAIVRRIISRHGGRTWAESKLNEGATFYFTLKTAGNGVKS